MRKLRVLDPVCIKTHVAADTKEEALLQVVKAAKESKGLSSVSEDVLFAGMKAREELGSTGFGGGIAIPHCRLPEVQDFVVGILTFSEGVAFEAIDDKPVRLMVFIVGPARESDEHISLLSEISHALMIPGAAEEMIAASTPEALTESFLRHSRDDLDSKDHTSKNLFHLFITNEDKFRKVLQVFSAMDATALSVTEARTAAEYLSKMPLFAGFWNDRTEGVCYAITALIEKKLTNETIRRIEQATESLDQSTDIALAVQDVFYATGMLRG